MLFLFLETEKSFDCMANFGRYGPITSSPITLGGHKALKIGPNIVQKCQNGLETLDGPPAKGEDILKTYFY